MRKTSIVFAAFFERKNEKKINRSQGLEMGEGIIFFSVVFLLLTFSLSGWSQGVATWNGDGSVSVTGGTVYFTSRLNYNDGSVQNGMVKMDIDQILHVLDRHQLSGSISSAPLTDSSKIRLEVHGFNPEFKKSSFFDNLYFGIELSDKTSEEGVPWDYQIDRKRKNSVFSVKSNNIRQLLQTATFYADDKTSLGGCYSNSLVSRESIPLQSVVVMMEVTNATVSGVTIPGVGYKRMDELFKDVARSNEAYYAKFNGTLISLNELIKQDIMVGDEIVFYSTNNATVFSGLPMIWAARSGGEVFYFSYDVEPGQLKPFLGFDSQVHGTALRKYPADFDPNEKLWSTENTEYSWTYKVQRPMDSYLNQDGVQFYWKKEKPGMSYIKPDGKLYTNIPQRNNQREGLNMCLLHTWWGRNNWNNPITRNPYRGSFSSSNDKYALFLDDDEFLIVNSQYYNTNNIEISRDSNGNPEYYTDGTPVVKVTERVNTPDVILSDDIVRWKTVPDGEKANCVEDLVNAYYDNRGRDPLFSCHEIEDTDSYFQFSDPSKPCSGAGCIYKPEDNSKEICAAGGNVFMTDDRGNFTKFQVNAKSPFNSGGFYTRITGTQWPSVYEKAVPYTLTGLNDLNPKASLFKFKLVYEFEDHLGILKNDVREYKNLSDEQKESIKSTGRWTEKFDIQGWGYHNITAYYNDVPVAGKELLEIDMRFLGVPSSENSENCRPCTLPGLPLNEERGEGEYWFVSDYNDTSPYQIPLYGAKNNRYVREYTFSLGDQVSFAANDADPLTFWSYKIDYYLSERTQAKRIPNDSLSVRKYLTWTLSPINYFGNQGREGYKVDSPIITDYGRYHTFNFSTPGTYELKVTYRGQSSIAHIIHVVDYNYSLDGSKEDADQQRRTKTKGEIQIYDLSPDQARWLGVSQSGAKYKIASVEKVLSKWKYTKGHGPRATTLSTMDERFEAYNNYQDEYLWYKNDGSELDSYKSNAEVKKFLANYEANERVNWFPKNWLRHKGTVKKRKDGSIDNVPIGIDPKLIKDALHNNFTDFDSKLSGLFNGPEAWQFRAPWIAYTTYSGYKTRSNIKTLYNMQEFFNADYGAFAGKGNVKYEGNLAQYYKDVSNALPSQSDEDKAKYQFYLDLLTKRKVLFEPATVDFLTVTNVNPDLVSANDTIVNHAYSGNYFIASSKTKSRYSLGENEFLLGADMSDISVMEANGDKWYLSQDDLNNEHPTDPYEVLAKYTTSNTVRFHLWADPVYQSVSKMPYPYSTIDDVAKQIKRAKQKGLKVILDVMFSDTWANPEQQIIPANIDSKVFSYLSPDLGSAVNSYMTSVVGRLSSSGAVPDFITVGNEISINMLMPQALKEYVKPNDPNKALKDEYQNDYALRQLLGRTEPSWILTMYDLYRINWDRQASIINNALFAINDYNRNAPPNGQIQTMLHFPFLNDAYRLLRQSIDVNAPDRIGKSALRLDLVDALGTSYYEMYTDESKVTLDDGPNGIKTYIESIKRDFGLDVVILETSFPYTLTDADDAENIITAAHVRALTKYCSYNSSSKLMECNFSADLQYQRMKKLIDLVRHSKGGKGVLYYSPFEKGTTTAFLDTNGSVIDNQGFFKDNVIQPKGAAKAFGFQQNGVAASNVIPPQQLVVYGVNYAIKKLSPAVTFGNANGGSGYTVQEVYASGDLFFTPLYTTNNYYYNGQQYMSIRAENNSSVISDYVLVGESNQIQNYINDWFRDHYDSQAQSLGPMFSVVDATGVVKIFSGVRFSLTNPVPSFLVGGDPVDHTGFPVSIDGPFILTSIIPKVATPQPNMTNAKLLNRSGYDSKAYLVCANRGYGESNQTENTSSAVARAAIYGADMVEIDIAKTKDNVLVLSHTGYPLGDTNFGTESKIQLFNQHYIDALQNVGKSNWLEAGSFLRNQVLIDNSKAVTPIHDLSYNYPDNYSTALMRNKDGTESSDYVSTLIDVFAIANTQGPLGQHPFDKLISVDRVFENGIAYDVLALALKAGLQDKILFKTGVGISVGELTETYGPDFMKQIIFSPYYFADNSNPSPWSAYQALQDKIQVDGWTVPAYELQFKSDFEKSKPGFKEMQVIRDQEQGKHWLGVTDAIPTSCDTYYFNWYYDNCDVETPFCSKYDRRADLEFTVGNGNDYFITEDLVNTLNYLQNKK